MNVDMSINMCNVQIGNAHCVQGTAKPRTTAQRYPPRTNSEPAICAPETRASETRRAKHHRPIETLQRTIAHIAGRPVVQRIIENKMINAHTN